MSHEPQVPAVSNPVLMSTVPVEGSWSRRDFVRNGLIAGVGAALLPNGQPAAAATPPARNGKSHLKLSLAAYSFNRVLPKNWSPADDGQPKMTLDDFIRFCADLDLDGTELTSYYFPRDVTPAYLAHLKELTFRLGLDITGTAIGNNFCVPAGPKRDEQLQLTRTWIDHAATLGAPVIRIFAGTAAKGQPEAEALDLCVAGIQKSLEYAAEKGVFLALENHGGITATAEQLLAIVKRVESPWFGVNLDSGNFQTADPYGDLAKIAPYAINAQIKSEISPNGKKQDADLARIVGILRDAGYRGYVVLEYEAAEEPKTAIPRHIETLRKLIRA
jgi:sugar phosphate isomerase/epimerase